MLLSRLGRDVNDKFPARSAPLKDGSHKSFGATCCRYSDDIGHQRLRSVIVEGFTSIRFAELALNDVNVLVGANGAGKSNFTRVLGMLGRIVDGELGLYVGQSGGASALLNADPANPRQIRLQVESDAGGYSAKLIPAAGDTLIFSSETIWRHNSDERVRLGRGQQETRLTGPEPLWPYEEAALVDMLRGCRVCHFQDTSRDAPVKRLGYISDAPGHPARQHEAARTSALGRA